MRQARVSSLDIRTPSALHVANKTILDNNRTSSLVTYWNHFEVKGAYTRQGYPIMPSAVDHQDDLWMAIKQVHSVLHEEKL